jgi:dephospho-CoA kinase
VIREGSILGRALGVIRIIMVLHSRTSPGRPRPLGPWKHGPIAVLGLIGGIGGGKSAVAAALARRGAVVLDADSVGRALLTRKPVRARLVAHFGARILDRTGAGGPDHAPPIDRRALAAIVFADAAERRALEAIVHPRMRRFFERAIARAVRQGQARAVVLDAAVLLEAGWDALCDLVVFVDAPRDRRLARLQEQRGWTEAMLAARERAQWPLVAKRGWADAIVVNDAGLPQLDAEVDRLWTVLQLSSRAALHPGPDCAGPSVAGSSRSAPAAVSSPQR